MKDKHGVEALPLRIPGRKTNWVHRFSDVFGVYRALILIFFSSVPP
jgi:hypothetical protein